MGHLEKAFANVPLRILEVHAMAYARLPVTSVKMEEYVYLEHVNVPVRGQANFVRKSKLLHVVKKRVVQKRVYIILTAVKMVQLVHVKIIIWSLIKLLGNYVANVKTAMDLGVTMENIAQEDGVVNLC